MPYGRHGPRRPRWSEDGELLPIKGEIRTVVAGDVSITEVFNGHEWVSGTGSEHISVMDYRPWAEIQAESDRWEQEAQQRAAEREAKEISLICIWCGRWCDTAEALENHEDECAG